jgi:hypothetical protein
MNATNEMKPVGTMNVATPGHEEPVKAAMEKAFALVKPEGSDWKGPIARLVLQSELDAANISIDRVKAAIEFFTATEATVEYNEKCNTMRGNGPGYFVEAAGYRAGPAGDH